VRLASQDSPYGYRRVIALLDNQGWLVNHKRVESIWFQEELEVSQIQPKRDRLWLNDGSIMGLKLTFPKHVWSYDFIPDRTHHVVALCILNVIDEYTRECLVAKATWRLIHKDVLKVLMDLFIERGVPVHVRLDNGSKFLPRRCACSSQEFRSSRCSSNQVIPGKMGILNPSTERCAMNC
jgi:transposase InsO family protein